jgi:hypothetical protein
MIENLFQQQRVKRLIFALFLDEVKLFNNSVFLNKHTTLRIGHRLIFTEFLTVVTLFHNGVLFSKHTTLSAEHMIIKLAEKNLGTN